MNTIIHIQSVKKTNTDIGISKSDMKKQQKMASNVEKKASQTGSITNTNVGNSVPDKKNPKEMISSSTDVGKKKSYASSRQTTGNGNSDKDINKYKNISKKSKTSNIIKKKT